MVRIIPAVKHMEIRDGFLATKAVCCQQTDLDARVMNALKKLPNDYCGACLTISIDGQAGEGYELSISENEI